MYHYFILDCSPIIFPGLLDKDFASIKKCIRLLSTSSGVAYTHICKVIISQHFNSCTRLSTSIINDPLHPSTPAFQKLCQLPTLDLLLNSFDVELLFIETPHPSPGPSSCKPDTRSRFIILQSFLRSTPLHLIIC